MLHADNCDMRYPCLFREGKCALLIILRDHTNRSENIFSSSLKNYRGNFPKSYERPFMEFHDIRHSVGYVTGIRSQDNVYQGFRDELHRTV